MKTMVFGRNGVSKKVPKLRFPQNLEKALGKQRFQHCNPPSAGLGIPLRTHGNHRGLWQIIGFSSVHASFTQVGAGASGTRPVENYGFPETTETHWKINVSGMCRLSRLSALRHTALEHQDSIERESKRNLWFPLMVASWTPPWRALRCMAQALWQRMSGSQILLLAVRPAVSLGMFYGS